MLAANEIMNKPEFAVEYLKQLRRIQPDKPIIITESSRDNLLFKKLHKELNSISISIKGKPKCLKTSEIAHNKSVVGCLALVDSDFDKIEEKEYSFPVVLTDKYDLESFAIFSENWSNVLNEYISEDKLSKAGIDSLEDFREKCMELCKPVASVLFANNKIKAGIDFKKYDFGPKSKITKDLTNNISSTIDRLKELNQDKSWEFIEELKSTAENFIEKINTENYQFAISSSLICNCIIGSSGILGIKRNDDDQIKRMDGVGMKKWFRSTVNYDKIKQSQMYLEIQEWIKSEQMLN